MSYKIISKFIKDVSFEIPNVQTFVMMEKEILNYNLNFDIKSQPFKENIIEVNTILKLVPNQDVKHKMLVEIINLQRLIVLVALSIFYILYDHCSRLHIARLCRSATRIVYDSFHIQFGRGSYPEVVGHLEECGETDMNLHGCKTLS